MLFTSRNEKQITQQHAIDFERLKLNLDRIAKLLGLTGEAQLQECLYREFEGRNPLPDYFQAPTGVLNLEDDDILDDI